MFPRPATTLTLKKVKGQGHCMVPNERIMHAKYQCFIINTSEDMGQVKAFVTDRQTDRGMDGQTKEF